jgi:hypothetical protein
MRTWPALMLALAVLAAPAAASAATGKPHFSRSYRGTLSGHLESRSGSRVIKADWTVKGLVFRLEHVRAFEGGWTGFYKVTAGTLSFSQTETGPCSYSVEASMPLAKSLPRPNPSAPLALDKNPLGKFYVLGLISPDKRLKTTETCTFPDGGEPDANPVEVEIPTIFDPGGSVWRPGRRLRGHRTVKDGFDEVKRTKSLSWSLKPGR